MAERHYLYLQCPECEYDIVMEHNFSGSTECPLCAEDSGHHVTMNCRAATASDVPEGRDARKEKSDG